MKNSDSTFISRFSSPPEYNDSDTLDTIRASRPPEPGDVGKPEDISSSTAGPSELSELSPPHREGSASPTEELSESFILAKILASISFSSSTELCDSVTKEKLDSPSPPKPDVSGLLLKISSCSSSEPTDSADSGTLLKISSCSSSEPTDSGTLKTITSRISPESDDGNSLLTMFEDFIHSLTLEYISVVNDRNKMEEEIAMNIKLNVELKKSSNKTRQDMELKELKYGMTYKERFSKCKKDGNRTRQAILKYIIRKVSNCLKKLIDNVNEEISKIVNIQKFLYDGSNIELQELYNSPTSDDMLCRSLALTVVNDFLHSEFEGKPSDPNYLVIITGILDKSTQARKCANWFLYKACNLDNVCEDIQYTWIYNSIRIYNYATLMDTSLGLNNGADKDYMYGVYINHKKGEFEKLYLTKLHQGQIDLEKSDKMYKLLEDRKPRFERSRLCKSEHSTPFCELCGWPSTWLKTFKKRGIFIKEAPHWTTKHIWYDIIKDELDE